MVASVHSCLFVVGGVSFPQDFYFVLKQFVRKWCAHQIIPFEIIFGILCKNNSQVLRALTLWMTPIITQILFHEQRRPLTKLLSFSVFLKLRRYFGNEQNIFVPHKPIMFTAHGNLRGISWSHCLIFAGCQMQILFIVQLNQLLNISHPSVFLTFFSNTAFRHFSTTVGYSHNISRIGCPHLK